MRIRVHHVSRLPESFRVAQIRGMFDLPRHEQFTETIEADLPLENLSWQIGAIVGPSGSGKTSLGRQLFGEEAYVAGYCWPDDAAVVDAFPPHSTTREVVQALSAVGFSSPPHWLKRYRELSAGQQFRCDLARALLDERSVVVLDEFSSLVDRRAARVSCNSLARALRKRGRPKLVALSCHRDILDWLCPDWVYDTSRRTFFRGRRRTRPRVILDIYRASRDIWELFSPHHYLNTQLHRAAQSFVACWEGEPVAFTSYVPLYGRRRARREHRTVVLPDYQGLGIGNAVSDWLGSWLKAQGLRFYSITSHPAMIRHRVRSGRWKLLRFGHAAATHWSSSSAGRLTATFLYIGPAPLPEVCHGCT
ncbi:MAG: GNAT family N-acetyltransferase [Gemmatales bacterium]|nr:GNAT family N-acetyltransferase [Gemmatales bacterium]MDW8222261.1 GNAT family N-acetyltransferase [Gemmatales bacterium]